MVKRVYEKRHGNNSLECYRLFVVRNSSIIFFFFSISPFFFHPFSWISFSLFPIYKPNIFFANDFNLFKWFIGYSGYSIRQGRHINFNIELILCVFVYECSTGVSLVEELKRFLGGKKRKRSPLAKITRINRH